MPTKSTLVALGVKLSKRVGGGQNGNLIRDLMVVSSYGDARNFKLCPLYILLDKH